MVGQTATVRASATHIQVVAGGELVADHVRQFGRDKTLYDPWHYLGILDHKPGGLRDGAPFKDWALPSSLRRIQEKLMARVGGDREFVAILQATQRYGLVAAKDACRQALAAGSVRGEVVVNLMARKVDFPDIDSVAVPDHLQLDTEPEANCARYDRKCRGGVSNATH